MRKDRPGRTSDGIVRHFAGQIDSGALSEGSMLPSERELAEKYGVSRTVIREAVQTLAMRGSCRGATTASSRCSASGLRCSL